MTHIHKQFTDDEVKQWLERYLKKEVRCWHDEKLIDVRTVKGVDLKL